MSLYRIEAVVLNHRYLGEADKLVTLYSRELGKMKAVAKGACRPRNRLLAGTQPYSHTEFSLFKGKSLDQISQCQLRESFYSLREDLQKMAAAAYIAELYDLLLEEREKNEELFYLLLTTLYLLTGSKDWELCLRYFELRFLSLVGYQPELAQCVNCRQTSDLTDLKFSSHLGGILCPRCWGQDQRALNVSLGSIALLKRLQVTSPRGLKVLRANAFTRKELRNVLQAYIAYFLPRELKSLSFLKLVQEDETLPDKK
ncbi:MAG: DNA repair protein RecO [bacterium]|jgi:DNA repair protein RecO (recombination protein O)